MRRASAQVRRLVRRSSKAGHEPETELAVFRGWAAPDPGTGAGIELVCGETCGHGQVMVIGEVLAREGFAPKDPPPPFNQIEPGGAHRKGDWVHAWVRGEPVLDRATGVTRAGIRDQLQVTGRVGLRSRREQGQIASGIARGRGLSEDLPLMDLKRARDPDLLRAAPKRQRGFDAVPSGGPARCRREGTGRHGAQLVETKDRRALRWVGGERDELGPFGTKSGSELVAQGCVRRQRTPARRKRHRT